MRSRSVEAELEAPWSSNLVLSSDGRRVFGLSPDRSLWSIEVPRAKSDPLSPRLELKSTGRIVAVDWQEDRLATIVLEDGQLSLSHGSGGFDLDPSRPAVLPLAQARVPLAESGALQPYLRWWREIDPMLGTQSPFSLLLGDDGHLYLLPIWEGAAEMGASTSCIGRDVRAMAWVPGRQEALFVGRAESPIKRGLLARWFGRHEDRQGAFRLSWEFMSSLPGQLLEFGPVSSAFIGHAGARSGLDYLLVASASSPGNQQWTIWRVYNGYVTQEAALLTVSAMGPVLGVVADDARQPFLVVREDDGLSLSLVNTSERVAFVRARAEIQQVIASLTSPLVIYVTADSRIGFAWLDAAGP